MPSFRLFNIADRSLEVFLLDSHPPYLAASHTWSENVFDSSVAFQNSFGGRGFATVLRERYPEVKYCWFDTVCIDQNDENDKLEQIPLMDRIFGQAVCVVVFISADLKVNQAQVDWMMGKIDGALAMCLAEAWKEEGAYWQSREGRKWLYMAQRGLLRLASTAWATRIWTLQEYVLAKAILWIGLDLQPLAIDDYVLSALPDICNTLAIEECLTPEFRPLDGYFAGMVNARMKTIDTTRIMELPGNRRATVPVDEVYGVMAASGVTIVPQPNESRAHAWARWCEEAVRQDHIRWILCPASSGQLLEDERETCIFPYFSQRHELSGSSGLDNVQPLGRIMVSEGRITTSARKLGAVRILNRLGTVHEPEHGSIYRDITLILFARGRWPMALRVVLAFGGGRYSWEQTCSIAQVLVQSYARAVRCVASHREQTFRPMLSSGFQSHAWTDFIKYQQSRMLGVNNGTSYLCKIRLPAPLNSDILTAIILGKVPPQGDLEALDFHALGPDGRPVLMVVQGAVLQDGTSTHHKVGMTLGVSDDIAELWQWMPVTQISLGGEGCSGCLNSCQPRGEHAAVATPVVPHSQRMHMLARQQERIRLKLWSSNVDMTGNRPRQHLRTRVRSRRLQAELMKAQSNFVARNGRGVRR